MRKAPFAKTKALAQKKQTSSVAEETRCLVCVVMYDESGFSARGAKVGHVKTVPN
jgi:hypothetical protein